MEMGHPSVKPYIFKVIYVYIIVKTLHVGSKTFIAHCISASEVQNSSSLLCQFEKLMAVWQLSNQNSRKLKFKFYQSHYSHVDYRGYFL